MCRKLLMVLGLLVFAIETIAAAERVTKAGRRCLKKISEFTKLPQLSAHAWGRSGQRMFSFKIVEFGLHPCCCRMEATAARASEAKTQLAVSFKERFVRA